MPIKHIIARGIGFSPGSGKYIPTLGFISTPLPVVAAAAAAPTATQIADALSGRRGPVVIRYRYEQRDHDFAYQADVTSAVETCSITLDNTRSILRTATMTIRPDLLPADFDESTDHIAVFAEVLAVGQYVRFSLGLFHLDRIEDKPTPNGNTIWNASASDMSLHLWENSVSQPYMVVPDTLYVDAINAVLALSDVATNMAASTRRTPSAFTWPAGTAHGQIINDLLDGINYFPAWADTQGRITSRERINPYLETAAVAYTTELEPRMVRENFSRVRDRGRYTNRIIAVVKDPARTPYSVQVTNDDDDSPISTVRKNAITATTVNTDRVATTALMTDIATYLLRDAAIRAQVGSLDTHLDPRRDAHEFYTVTIESAEVSSPWRAESWIYPCVTGATMAHRIGRADQVDVHVAAVTA